MGAIVLDNIQSVNWDYDYDYEFFTITCQTCFIRFS
jgi:hypothetical protein